MDETRAVLIILEAAAVLLVVAGIPLVLRRVGPNWLYGFRTPATLSDERLWYEVNARTGADVVVLGVLVGVLAWALAAAGLPEGLYAGICTAVLIVGVLGSLVHGLLIVRAYRDRNAPGGSPGAS